jgi:hypothetical protein
MQLLGTNIIMKILKKPTNIYRVVVTETRAVTYLVHAKSSDGASSKALHSWDQNDVKEIKSDRHEYDVESIECVEKDIYNDI